MLRRCFLLAGSALALPATAQVADLPDAINKAGRQRMLSQRMAKAWLAILQGVDTGASQKILDASLALFDRQLVELKAYAPNPGIQDIYQRLEPAWGGFKTLLVGSAPTKSRAAALLTADAQVLALAHAGTQAYEAAHQRPVGRLVNLAGRQRMLSQRMAKLYLAATLPVDARVATAEIQSARAEFMAAMNVLKQAPEATQRIREELQLADAQWLFFDHALQRVTQTDSAQRHAHDVLVASENILSAMDRVTGLYASLKA